MNLLTAASLDLDEVPGAMARAAAHLMQSPHVTFLSLEHAVQHQNVRAVQVGYDQLAYELERLERRYEHTTPGFDLRAVDDIVKPFKHCALKARETA